MYYNRLFNEDGSSTTLPRKVTDFTYQLYGEYGLTNKLTFIGLVPMKYVATGSEIFQAPLFTDTLPNGSLGGISNLSFALKYALIQKTYLLSIQLRVDASTYVAERNTGLQTGYDYWTYNPSLHFGRAYNKFYFTAETGIRLKSRGASTAWHAGIELGYSKNKKTWFALVVDDVESLKRDYFQNLLLSRGDGNFAHTGLYTEDQESFSYGGKIFHYLGKRTAIHLAAYGAFAGNQVPHFPSLNLGFSYEWKK